MTCGKGKRYEYAGNHAETGAPQLIAVQCILESLKFAGTALGIFQRLKKSDMLYAFLDM